VASIDQISIAGFCEPIRLVELRETRCASVPAQAGIYLIEREPESAPQFRIPSTGGWFKGQDPNCALDIIEAKWVGSAHILYVGKAPGKKGLKGRLRQLIDFGNGKPVGHRGGRLLWHLQDSEDLLVRWRTCTADETDRAEMTAIADFRRSHRGMRPFANMNK
jgi:hypothetical protein